MTLGLYEYRAMDAAGRTQSGRVEAEDRAAAVRRVRDMGLTPVKLAALKQRRRSGRRMTSAQVAQFTYELSTLLEAAVPIGEGLRAVAEQETDARARSVVSRIAMRVESGSSVTDALREHERVFGPVYIETIAAAENSGSMRMALEQLGENIEWQVETSRRLKQAMMYPIAVMIALGGGTAFLLAFVVPKFTTMFADRGVELPALTRGLDAAGQSLQGFWWAYAAAIAAVFIGLRAASNTPGGRLVIDQVLHAVPAVSRILRSVGMARFARTLGMSLRAGVGLTDAIEQSGRASGRPALAAQSLEMSKRIRSGSSLHDALAATPYMPGFAKRMLAAGEESAELPRLCGVIARRYEREAEHFTKNIGTLVEPVLIALLTGVVLVVALGIFLPMWDMSAVMK